MARLLFFLGLAVVLYLLIRWISRQSPKLFLQWILILLAVGVLILFLTGRAHWLTALFAALLPFLRIFLNLLGSLPMLRRLLAMMRSSGQKPAAGGRAGPAQSSTVQSRYIRMSLNHDTGDIDGEVLDGRHQGRHLGQMALDELMELYDECREDEESAALLQAYLDRVYGDSWHQQDEQRRQSDENPSAPGGMTRVEALQVLGLSDPVSDEEIIEAHRRLIQKLHPDRGGSAYLAATINRAKEILLQRNS